MSDFPEKLYSVDPPNQSSDGLYMIVHTKKTDKYTVEYTRTDLTRPTEDAEKLVDELIHLIKTQCKKVRRHGLTEEIKDLKSRLLSMNKEVVDLLKEARNQIEYLHGKFQATGTGNAVIARIDEALEGKEG